MQDAVWCPLGSVAAQALWLSPPHLCPRPACVAVRRLARHAGAQMSFLCGPSAHWRLSAEPPLGAMNCLQRGEVPCPGARCGISPSQVLRPILVGPQADVWLGPRLGLPVTQFLDALMELW